jgi:hypothetical protein
VTAVIATFVEAVRATGQPCTFLLLAPTLLTVAALRATWWSVASVFGAAIVGGWLAAVNVFVLDGWLLQVSGVVVAASVAAAVALPVGRSPRSERAITSSIAAAVTLLASMWWRPCVGAEFGELLTTALTDRISPLPGLAVYMVGAVLPVLVVALVWRTIAPPPRAERAVGLGATVAVCVIALAVAVGRHDTLVTGLTRWTSAAT